MTASPDPPRPPYTPLRMADVHAAPLSGLTHISTFSGGGGTCLGFRLAGYQTLWANDLDAHARASYRLNLSSPITGLDIRTVTAAQILRATGLQRGQLDVFEGSPPCTAFSTAGTREKGWNRERAHAGAVQTNVEDLFFEWLRLLDGLQPRAFVAENVAGLVKGTAKGYFKAIMRRMKAMGYLTAAQLIDAQWLGVPQRRMRVIFIGIRADLQRPPQFPRPLPYRYTVRDALPHLAKATHDSRGWHNRQTPAWFYLENFMDDPAPPITASATDQYRVIHREGGYDGSVSTLDRPSPTLTNQSVLTVEPVEPVIKANSSKDWIFTQSLDEASPTVLKECSLSLQRGPGPTGSRRFAIAEVKRLCSFPDDYLLTGTYAQQWARLGNSVPPLMAAAIGRAVRDVLHG